MADTYLCLPELVKINDQNAADYGVSDLFDDAPFLKALSATAASNGSDHKYLKETGAPVVGFRAPCSGLENSASADTLVTINLKILDASFAVDKAIADGYYKGAEAFISREAKRHLKAAFFMGEKQLINGTANHADGFNGLRNAMGAVGPYVVDAGGTTATTGSSIYLIRTGESDVQAVMGNDGQIKVDQTIVQRIEDATGKHYPAYFTPIQSWMGLQVGGAASVVRIANVTADSDKGATDALIVTALSRFPASRMPNLIVMGRRSRGQLQGSRTATNATGAPANFPTEVFGIPVIVTDAIGENEAIVA